jgi:hypothetical protein
MGMIRARATVSDAELWGDSEEAKAQVKARVSGATAPADFPGAEDLLPVKAGPQHPDRPGYVTGQGN